MSSESTEGLGAAPEVGSQLVVPNSQTGDFSGNEAESAGVCWSSARRVSIDDPRMSGDEIGDAVDGLLRLRPAAAKEKAKKSPARL